MCGFQGTNTKAWWLSWLERRPVTAEVDGSSPFWVAFGILAQLGEHLPYKQGVTGSSPVLSTTYLARWCSRLARQPVTLEVDSSSLFRVAKKSQAFGLALSNQMPR